MGCCQTSTLARLDQMSIYGKEDNHVKHELVRDKRTEYNKPSNISNRIAALYNVIYSQDDLYLFYTRKEMICSMPLGNKYRCSHNHIDISKEMLILMKSKLNQSSILQILTLLTKLAQTVHDNLLKIYFISEDKTSIRIIVDPSSEVSLAYLIKEEKLNGILARNYIQQVISAGLECEKSDIILSGLSPETIFVTDKLIKISPLALITPNFELHKDKKNDIWNIGVILLNIITSNLIITDINATVNELSSSSIQKEDYEMLKRLFSDPCARPSYRELLQHSWNLDLPVKYNLKLSQFSGEILEKESESEKNSIEIEILDNNNAPEKIENSPTLSNYDDEVIIEKKIFDSMQETLNDEDKKIYEIELFISRFSWKKLLKINDEIKFKGQKLVKDPIPITETDSLAIIQSGKLYDIFINSIPFDKLYTNTIFPDLPDIVLISEIN